MSIASSLDEILYHKPDIRDWELMRSGLNIGRDIMGTMANTLVLAYVGSSLHMILLLLAYNNDIGSIINRETIAVELLQSVAGSIGILLTVPSTAAVTVLARRWFLSHAQRQREEEAAAEAAEPQPLPEACAEAGPAVPEEPEEDTPEPEAPRTVEELWREYQKKEK